MCVLEGHSVKEQRKRVVQERPRVQGKVREQVMILHRANQGGPHWECDLSKDFKKERELAKSLSWARVLLVEG